MPVYEFECSCGNYFEEFHPMAEMPQFAVCSVCSGDAEKIIPTRQYVTTFNPVVTSDITGKPIEITSAKHRDELCKKHNLTCDSSRWVRKKEVPAAVDSLDYGEVKAALERGCMEDGTPLEKPVQEKDLD